MLEWSQDELAKTTVLSAVTIRSFENGGGMRDSNRNLLTHAFEKVGLEFIPENGGGAGIRFRERSS